MDENNNNNTEKDFVHFDTFAVEMNSLWSFIHIHLYWFVGFFFALGFVPIVRFAVRATINTLLLPLYIALFFFHLFCLLIFFVISSRFTYNISFGQVVATFIFGSNVVVQPHQK